MLKSLWASVIMSTLIWLKLSPHSWKPFQALFCMSPAVAQKSHFFFFFNSEIAELFQQVSQSQQKWQKENMHWLTRIQSGSAKTGGSGSVIHCSELQRREFPLTVSGMSCQPCHENSPEISSGLVVTLLLIM